MDRYIMRSSLTHVFFLFFYFCCREVDSEFGLWYNISESKSRSRRKREWLITASTKCRKCNGYCRISTSKSGSLFVRPPDWVRRSNRSGSRHFWCYFDFRSDAENNVKGDAEKLILSFSASPFYLITPRRRNKWIWAAGTTGGRNRAGDRVRGKAEQTKRSLPWGDRTQNRLFYRSFVRRARRSLPIR